MTGLQTLVALLLVVYPSQACFPKATTTPPATCPAVNVPTDGNVFYYKGRQVNSYLMYICDIDFTLTGNTMRKCESGLKWDGNGDVAGEVTCSRMSCPELIVSNGMVTYTTRVDGGTATITCDSGYIIVGTSPRTCEAALTWSGDAPTCEKKCPVLTAPANGAITYTLGRAPTGLATYVCTPPAVQQEDSVAPRKCQADFTWDGVPITCAAACPMLEITNGMVTYQGTTGRIPPQIATYSCTTGAFQGMTTTRSCADDGTFTWTKNPSADPEWRCDLVCPPIDATGKTWTVAYSSPSRGPTTVATHTCSTTGDTVSTGDAMRTCQADFTWGGTEPVCTTPARRRLLSVLLGDRD